MFPCRRSVVEILINLSRYNLQKFSLFVVISNLISVDVNYELSGCLVIFKFFGLPF